MEELDPIFVTTTVYPVRTDAKKAKKKQTEVRTEFEYCGLNLPVPRDPQNSVSVVFNHSRESKDNHNDISITGMYVHDI